MLIPTLSTKGDDFSTFEFKAKRKEKKRKERRKRKTIIRLTVLKTFSVRFGASLRRNNCEKKRLNFSSIFLPFVIQTYAINRGPQKSICSQSFLKKI